MSNATATQTPSTTTRQGGRMSEATKLVFLKAFSVGFVAMVFTAAIMLIAGIFGEGPSFGGELLILPIGLFVTGVACGAFGANVKSSTTKKRGTTHRHRTTVTLFEQMRGVSDPALV